jgi:hypothetical protein
MDLIDYHTSLYSTLARRKVSIYFIPIQLVVIAGYKKSRPGHIPGPVTFIMHIEKTQCIPKIASEKGAFWL